MEVVDLRTRLGPGHGKVMNPLKLWAGFVTIDNSFPEGSAEYRQIAVFAEESSSDDGRGSVRFSVLGCGRAHNAKDFIIFAEAANEKISEPVIIDLPHRSGRIVPSSNQIWWQSPDGQLFSGTPMLVYL